MGISFFTKTPFSVTLNEKIYELSNKQKTLIVIAAIVGLALFLVGAVFTFYSASYLLRKYKFEQIVAERQNRESTLTQNGGAARISSTSHTEIIKRTIDDLNRLKNIDDLESIDFTLYYGSKWTSYNEVFSETPVMKLSERLPQGLDFAFNLFNSKGENPINWAIIAKDRNGIHHAVIRCSGNKPIDFFRDVNSGDLSSPENYHRNKSFRLFINLISLAFKQEMFTIGLVCAY